MISEINCPIISNEKFNKEILSDIVTSLEQVEVAKKTIFNRLNSAVQKRITRFCNIKARINLANKIISSLSSIQDEITFKSKRNYPYQKHNYYIPTIIDKNASKLILEPTIKMNKNVLNDKNILGMKSSAIKDRIDLYASYLSFANQFNDIVNDLDKIYKEEANVRQIFDEIEPILNHTTSNFVFGTNTKIENAKKNKFNPSELDRHTLILKEIQDAKRNEKEIYSTRTKKYY